MLSNNKFSILVIDDDLKFLEMIQTFFSLKEEEVLCVVAEDAQQAALKVANQNFDLIIVDNIMPGKMGLDYALYLKHTPKNSKIPIVLISSSFMQKDILRAIEGGVTDIMVKPFSLKDLGNKVKSYMDKFKKIKQNN